ncbi:chemokine-like receptor 1 [Rhinatrema bivittatum]|uniref:chemokine-like receptor 1 n=1 Tax=Rhinatrema bivittatum TaxID=194408 RepID=UPI00112778D6|nr:chemokine-like receptor 1 [Rhinatrema bivittatum]
MNWTNGTSSEDEIAILRETMKIITAVAFSLIFLLGVTGNGTVIWITGCKLRRTINTVWFFNLALADFISTFLIFITILYLALDLNWPFGPVFCKLVNCTFGLSIYTSILLLSAISIDRCVLGLFPVWCQNYRTTKMITMVCLIIWVLSIALVPGSYIFSEMSTEQNRSSCRNLDIFEDWERKEADVFTVCIFLYQFFIPLIIILISYAILIFTIRKKRLNKSSKPLLVITGVVFSFFLCWLPYHAFALARISVHRLPRTVLYVAIPISKCLAMLNSCINPILYVFVGHEFKDVVKRSLTQVFRAAFEEMPHPAL